MCGLTGYVDYVYPNGPDTARYAVLFERDAQDQWFLAPRGLSWLPDVGGWHEGTMTGLTAVVSDGEVLYTAAMQPHVGQSPYRTMNRTRADMRRVLEFTAQQGLRITALTATRERATS